MNATTETSPTAVTPSHLSQRQRAAFRLFQNENAYGVPLLFAARTVLDPDELETYASETIRLELQDSLHLPKIDPDCFDRLMAVLTAIKTDLFYQDLHAFIDICNILSGSPGDPTIFDPADPYEIAWAITEIGLIDEEDGNQFSEEIRAYMGFTLWDHGMLSAPRVMSMAIMPDDLQQPAEQITDENLLPTIFENNQERTREISEMIRSNAEELGEQMKPFFAGRQST